MSTFNNYADMVFALEEQIGKQNTLWLAEWYPELFESPIKGYIIRDFVHKFDTMEEVLEWFDAETLEEAEEEASIFMDNGLDGIVVIE